VANHSPVRTHNTGPPIPPIADTLGMGSLDRINANDAIAANLNVIAQAAKT
jgi:hypothetical protein